MMAQLFLVNAVLLAVYITGWFLVAKKRDRLNTIDVAWGPGFLLVALAVLWQHPGQASFVVAAMVGIWSLRLAVHLYRRIFSEGPEDPRYEAIAQKWRGNKWARAYVSIFLLQALLILVISMPITFAATTQDHKWWLTIVGVAVWLFGFAFESIADKQLRRFLADPTNKGNVMDKGLWAYSRHPNYFGELTQWWAIGIVALQADFGWIGLIGPATLTFLMVFISGIPPIENRKKTNPAYVAYMRRTSRLVPLPRKHDSQLS